MPLCVRERRRRRMRCVVGVEVGETIYSVEVEYLNLELIGTLNARISHTHTYIYIIIYIDRYMYMYVYVERERERGRDG